MTVFINDVSAFLPNGPVENDKMEAILGMTGQTPSLIREKILNSNQIKTRYYAIDPETRESTHTNAQLTASAVRKLKPHNGFTINDIRCLACGTSSPDMILPGHGLMVHGELGIPGCEVMTTAGICLSGITALKYAWMNVETCLSDNAVSTGSETASSFMRSEFFTPGGDPCAIEDRPELLFDAEFLRWMLSDGAGAVFMSREKNSGSLSLRIDWIEHRSFADTLTMCMYAGGIKKDDGSASGWRDFKGNSGVPKDYLFALKQDTKLLGREILKTGFNFLLKDIAAKRGLHPDDYAYYLPHYSSGYFRDKIYNVMKEIDFEIPYEKWFTNLSTKGNIGSASIYIILDELFHSDKLRNGDKLLCFIPESGRFSHAFMQLTAV